MVVVLYQEGLRDNRTFLPTNNNWSYNLFPETDPFQEFNWSKWKLKIFRDETVLTIGGLLDINPLKNGNGSIDSIIPSDDPSVLTREEKKNTTYTRVSGDVNEEVNKVFRNKVRIINLWYTVRDRILFIDENTSSVSAFVSLLFVYLSGLFY